MLVLCEVDDGASEDVCAGVVVVGIVVVLLVDYNIKFYDSLMQQYVSFYPTLYI